VTPFEKIDGGEGDRPQRPVEVVGAVWPSPGQVQVVTLEGGMGDRFEVGSTDGGRVALPRLRFWVEVGSQEAVEGFAKEPGSLQSGFGRLRLGSCCISEVRQGVRLKQSGPLSPGKQVVVAIQVLIIGVLRPAAEGIDEVEGEVAADRPRVRPVNTSQQLGNALALAAIATLAATWTPHPASASASHPAAGYAAGFLLAAGIILAALIPAVRLSMATAPRDPSTA
jgi:hypothetical protein